MQYPVKLGGTEHVVQLMADGEDRVLIIADRYYRIYRDPQRNTYYTMLRVAHHQRSLNDADLSVLITKIARIHQVYRGYEDRCRRAKEQAAQERDRQLNAVLES